VVRFFHRRFVARSLAAATAVGVARGADRDQAVAAPAS